jgi:two-component system chemotaxis response regulator CheY
VIKTILVVDDSSTMRSLVATNLSEWGDFEIVEAGSGFEALKILPSRKVDLILTDINMPDINGLELISFVKSNPIYRHIPLIIITTEASEEDRQKGLELGAKEYIIKPFKMEELRRAIRKVFEH